MHIRPARSSDLTEILPMIAKICALHKEWDQAKYGFLPNPEQLYKNWLGRIIKSSADLCLVAEIETEDADSLVGLLIATAEQEVPIYRLKQFAFVHDLWVEENYRKQGIARQMVLGAIAHFSNQGIEQIRLDTAMANENARQLFASCGFRVSTVEMLMELT
jgi:ribosomal protein S18 acetylase RimI-like enzyme